MTTNTAADVLKTLFMRDERVSAFSLGALFLLAVVIMGLLSLALLNDKATKGYLLNSLEEDRQELVTDGEITEMLILQARSFDKMMENPQVRRMVEPQRDAITYVTPVVAVAQSEL